MSCEAEYFSKDFEWEELRAEIEANPYFRYHLLPFEQSSSLRQAETDVNAWEQFHSRHSSGKFFKERRYLVKEFPELLSCGENAVLEVGCGNGSTALPILRANKDVIVYACDCSSKSLERAQEVIGSATIGSFEDRFRTFCCDVSTNGFPQWLACNSCRNKFLQKQPNCISESKEGNEPQFTNTCSPEECDGCIGGVNFLTLIFTLSAIPLERMLRSIKECFAVLKPGGMLFFRDYGLYDMTMLRFEQAKRVGFREYKRSDGTRSYFFCLDTVRDLFVGAGFTEVPCFPLQIWGAYFINWRADFGANAGDEYFVFKKKQNCMSDPASNYIPICVFVDVSWALASFNSVVVVPYKVHTS